MHPHKVVQYIEDSSSQHDDTADDSKYYISSQASQDSLLQMSKEKMETSSRVINKQKPKVEERRKEKMKPSKEVEELHYTELEKKRK